MIELRVDRAELTVLRRECVVSGASRVYKVKFYFSDDWDRYDKYAVFEVERKKYQATDTVNILLPYNNSCTIPQTLLNESGVVLYIGVYGIAKPLPPPNVNIWPQSDEEDPEIPDDEPIDPTDRPTIWCKYDIIRKGATPNDVEVSDAMKALANIQNDIMDQVRTAEIILDSVNEVKDEVLALVEKVKELSSHQPIPGDNGFWLIWDADEEAYVETTAPWQGEPGPGVPPGGIFGQMLTKRSEVDYDTTWSNPPVLRY